MIWVKCSPWWGWFTDLLSSLMFFELTFFLSLSICMCVCACAWVREQVSREGQECGPIRELPKVVLLSFSHTASTGSAHKALPWGAHAHTRIYINVHMSVHKYIERERLNVLLKRRVLSKQSPAHTRRHCMKAIETWSNKVSSKTGEGEMVRRGLKKGGMRMAYCGEEWGKEEQLWQSETKQGEQKWTWRRRRGRAKRSLLLATNSHSSVPQGRADKSGFLPEEAETGRHRDGTELHSDFLREVKLQFKGLT